MKKNVLLSIVLSCLMGCSQEQKKAEDEMVVITLNQKFDEPVQIYEYHDTGLGIGHTMLLFFKVTISNTTNKCVTIQHIELNDRSKINPARLIISDCTIPPVLINEDNSELNELPIIVKPYESFNFMVRYGQKLKDELINELEAGFIKKSLGHCVNRYTPKNDNFFYSDLLMDHPDAFSPGFDDYLFKEDFSRVKLECLINNQNIVVNLKGEVEQEITEKQLYHEVREFLKKR